MKLNLNSELNCICCCIFIQVLGFAVFFALVLKTVDQEEYGDIPIEGASSSTGSLYRRFANKTFPRSVGTLVQLVVLQFVSGLILSSVCMNECMNMFMHGAL